MSPECLRVMLNFRSGELWDWSQEVLTLKLLPRVGEYVSTSDKCNWYRVELVLHESQNPEIDAVLYAIDAGMAFDRHLQPEPEALIN